MVGEQLARFAPSGIKVLAAEIYGTFGEASQARTALSTFDKLSRAIVFADRQWRWDLAFEGPTIGYDPEGIPDSYFLVNMSDQVVFQDSVLMSTTLALLAHLRKSTFAAAAPATAHQISGPLSERNVGAVQPEDARRGFSRQCNRHDEALFIERDNR